MLGWMEGHVWDGWERTRFFLVRVAPVFFCNDLIIEEVLKEEGVDLESCLDKNNRTRRKC